MVLLQGLRSSSIAALIGILFALAVSRLTTAAASHVNPMDTTIYAGVFLFLLIVTGAACYVPAYRASRVDPNITLRD